MRDDYQPSDYKGWDDIPDVDDDDARIVTPYEHGLAAGRSNSTPSQASGFRPEKLATGRSGYVVDAEYLDAYIRGRCEANVKFMRPLQTVATGGRRT